MYSVASGSCVPYPARSVSDAVFLDRDVAGPLVTTSDVSSGTRGECRVTEDGSLFVERPDPGRASVWWGNRYGCRDGITVNPLSYGRAGAAW